MTRTSFERDGPNSTVGVLPRRRRRQELAHERRQRRRLLRRLVPVAFVDHRQPADPGARQLPCPVDRLPLAPRFGRQLALVEDLARVLADRRVQPPRPVEEQAERRRHDRRPRFDRSRTAFEQVSQRRPLGSGRMRALERLVELLRVAEQHEAPGRRRYGDDVRERHLAGLVDEQDVDRAAEVLARPDPGRPAGDVDLARRERVAQLAVRRVAASPRRTSGRRLCPASGRSGCRTRARARPRPPSSAAAR